MGTSAKGTCRLHAMLLDGADLLVAADRPIASCLHETCFRRVKAVVLNGCRYRSARIDGGRGAQRRGGDGCGRGWGRSSRSDEGVDRLPAVLVGWVRREKREGARGGVASSSQGSKESEHASRVI